MSSMDRQRTTKISMEILQLAATGVLIYVAAGSPKGALAIDKWVGRALSRQARHYWRKRIQKLQHEGFIIMSGEKIRLSSKGKKLLQEIEYRTITVPVTSWKGTWHIVTYDIPDIKKAHRDAFHRRIKELGFVQIQKSVFAMPYECKEIIAILAQQHKVAPYVIYMHAQDLPMNNKLKKHFGIP